MAVFEPFLALFRQYHKNYPVLLNFIQNAMLYAMLSKHGIFCTFEFVPFVFLKTTRGPFAPISCKYFEYPPVVRRRQNER